MNRKPMRFSNRTLLTKIADYSLGVWLPLNSLLPVTLSQDASSLSDLPSSQYDRVQINSLSFRVRSDLEFELVADSNIVRWPIVATWDADGNLLIAESAGVKQSVQDQQVSRPHRVIRLMDHDRDGKFDSQVVVADDFAFPEGLMVYGKHLLVSAPPEIWKLTDNDGDGIYEQRDVWHDGATLTHCANDLHGPFLGPEGWVYWTKSAFAKQSFPMRQSYVQDSSASHLYRKPFDSKLADRVLTGGMDNLVHIGHNVTVGRDCLLCGQVGIAGSARIGDRVVLAGQCGVNDNIFVGDDVIAGGATKIFTNAPAGRVLLGYPAVKMSTHIEMQKALRRLPRLAATVAALQKAISKPTETD